LGDGKNVHSVENQKSQNNQKRLKFQNQLGVTIAFACLSGFGDMFLKDAREFRKSTFFRKMLKNLGKMLK
jgi:hypothetical protein